MSLGAHNREGFPTSVQETINVVKVTYHKRFNDRRLLHDVAVLKLEKPITVSDEVNTVCLPKSKSDRVAAGKNCYITGNSPKTKSLVVSNELMNSKKRESTAKLMVVNAKPNKFFSLVVHSLLLLYLSMTTFLVSVVSWLDEEKLAKSKSIYRNTSHSEPPRTL